MENLYGGGWMTDVATKLREQPIRKVFLSYLIPSTFGLLLLSINLVIDGIFIGHGVGPNGLAAVNISVPIYSFFYGIALWIGMGGATLFSIQIGKGNVKEAQRIFTMSFIISVVISLVISAVSLLMIEQLAYFFGANDVIIDLVLDYMFVLVLFGIIFVLESYLSVFIRNDGNPLLAMSGLVASAVFNIILNYYFIFVFGWGVKGAAYAIVIANFLAVVIMSFHFVRKKSILKFVKVKINLDTIRNVLTFGFPSFISEASIAIMTFGYNIAFIRMIGETGVAAFSIVNYLHTMVLLMFIGVGSAIQPLVSFYYGAKLQEKVGQSLRLGVITSIIFGAVSLLAGIVFAGPLAHLFNATESPLYEMTVTGIKLFFINYLFLGINMVYATYYQSIGKVKLSVQITFARSILFVVIFLLVLPPFIGTNGVWLSVPVAEGLAFLLILYVRKQNASLMNV